MNLKTSSFTGITVKSWQACLLVMKVLLLLGWVAYHLQVVSSQECTRENLEDFPTVAALVARSLAATLGGGSSPTINIQDLNIVCLAVDTTASNFRGASLVVQYNISTCDDPNNITCPTPGNCYVDSYIRHTS